MLRKTDTRQPDLIHLMACHPASLYALIAASAPGKTAAGGFHRGSHGHIDILPGFIRHALRRLEQWLSG
jgi:hypothetical protein